MKHINLFGGPGTGKSTTAAGTFSGMKAGGYKVELIQEFAKELVYAENWTTLSDQFLVTATQHHRSFLLKGKVDYVIHDSPILLGVVYADFEPITGAYYEQFVVSLFKGFNSINIFLERDLVAHPYQTYGRSQSVDKAIEKDREILALLEKHSIDFIKVPMVDAISTVQEIIRKKGKYD